MVVETRIFELCDARYKNLSELAEVMEISVSQIYRVREGARRINQKFIIGAIKAFPDYKLDELFYLAPESPTVNKNYHYQHATTPATKKSKDRELTVAGT